MLFEVLVMKMKFDSGRKADSGLESGARNPYTSSSMTVR
jgi:hypothetical protein